jgi:ketosteroid isomerase-like protein
MTILFAGFTLVAAAWPVAEAAPANAIEREIAQLEQEVNAAYAANSLDKYFSYYADDLVAIFYNERWTLARYKQEWPKYVQAGNVVVSAKLSDMIVRLSAAGDVAVASFQIELRNRHADGKTIDEHAFETDVWTKRKGAWKITHAHYALAVPAP